MKRVVLWSVLAFLMLVPAASAAPLDFGRQTWNVLPSGQSGSLPPDEHSVDQLRIYDALTPLSGDVTPNSITSYFKSARFFAPKGGPVTRPKRGVKIRRDSKWGVPHIQARTRSDVYWAIGWTTAQETPMTACL